MTSTSVVSSPAHCARRDELLAAFDGDDMFVADLVAIFRERCPVLVGSIRQAFADGDLDAVSSAAHALEGAIAYFEHGDAYAAAAELERAGAAHVTPVPSLIDCLERCVDQVLAYLDREFHP